MYNNIIKKFIALPIKKKSLYNYSYQFINTCRSKFNNNRFFSNVKRPLYLDHQSTTPVDPRVLEAMLPFYVDMYGNPHSRTHAFGWEAEHYVEKARKQVAKLINAKPREIIFTSGATESNNLAIKGVASYLNKIKEKKNHIITTQIEHKCVLASCRDIAEQYGWDITYLPTDSAGIIQLEKLKEAIRPETALVSIMTVNNEIGVIQPIEEIGKICKDNNVLFHTDAAQACGKIPVDVNKMNIDLLSISGHKLYGPKGVGALYIKQKRPRTRLLPIISGGGQERGLRSGTVPTPLVVGLGEACKVAIKEMDRDSAHAQKLAKLYKGNLNLSFAAVEGESLLMHLKNIAISSGSACTSASLEPSYVLHAIGIGDDLAHTSLRFGIGRFTTEEEIRECAKAVIEKVKELREISPLWEVVDNKDAQNEFVWT